MNNEINIPFGLCEIYYDGEKLPFIADEAVFSAIPTYQKMTGGALNSVQGYILESYDVKFTVSLNEESYNTLKKHMPTMKSHEYGLYDNPSKVDMTGKKLVIHPYHADSKDYDICIWNAYLSPEVEFTRTYKKETDSFEIVFIGKRVKAHTSSELVNSYFYIGDWEKVGEAYA